MNRLTFCGYPSAFLYEQPSVKSPVRKHFLWGDTLQVLEEAKKNGFLHISGRDESGCGLSFWTTLVCPYSSGLKAGV